MYHHLDNTFFPHFFVIGITVLYLVKYTNCCPLMASDGYIGNLIPQFQVHFLDWICVHQLVKRSAIVCIGGVNSSNEHSYLLAM